MTEIKIIARHERDDRDIELDDDQAGAFNLDFAAMYQIGIRRFETADGWTYRLDGPPVA